MQQTKQQTTNSVLLSQIHIWKINKSEVSFVKLNKETTVSIADSECVIWIHMMILSVKVIEWFFPCGSYYDQRLRQTWWPSRGMNVNWAGINIKYTSTVVNREAQECSVAATDGSLAILICLIAAPGIKIQVHDVWG